MNDITTVEATSPDEFWALVRPICGEPAFIFDGAENTGDKPRCEATSA